MFRSLPFSSLLSLLLPFRSLSFVATPKLTFIPLPLYSLSCPPGLQVLLPVSVSLLLGPPTSVATNLFTTLPITLHSTPLIQPTNNHLAGKFKQQDCLSQLVSNTRPTPRPTSLLLRPLRFNPPNPDSNPTPTLLRSYFKHGPRLNATSTPTVPSVFLASSLGGFREGREERGGDRRRFS